MALHEVVVRQTYRGQECINRYNYVSSGTPAAVTLSFGLAAAMGWITIAAQTTFDPGTFAAAQQEVQNAGVAFVDVLVKDVYGVEDFYTTSFNPGTVGAFGAAATGESPFTAYGFRSNRTRLDIKAGFKRFVGADETVLNNGGLIDPVFRSGQLQDLADALGDTLEYDDEGNTLTYQPVIVSKFKYTTPGGNNAYRYYTEEEGGEAEQLQHVANANTWLSYSVVRSQVSRQLGRGR